MAPTRKNRGVNKRFSFANEVSPSKDGDNSKKSAQRKRKVSDMLGSQWSKEELERFYEAYRNFGKDWKKVGGVLRNRSVEMVEALYMMNRAYLSLPEGTASVAGLIAMMTDHYCNMAGSDSEQESNDDGETSRKIQKSVKGSVRTKITKKSEKKPLSHSEKAKSNTDCLSLLKMPSDVFSPVTRPRAVGKRTPRFPVSFSNEKNSGGNFNSPYRQGSKRKPDTDDDSVEHEVAMVLAGAAQRGGSPPVSQTSNRRIWSQEKMVTGLEMNSAKHLSDSIEDGLELSLKNRVRDKGEFARERSFLMGSEKNHVDEDREANGDRVGKISRHITKKKNKKALFSGDEGSDFDALQTLADLSLMMPAIATEDEKSVYAKEKEDSLGGKPGSKPGKEIINNNNGIIPEAKEQPQQSTSRLSRKMLVSKLPRPDVDTVMRLSVSQEAVARDAEMQATSKGKRSPFTNSQHKYGKSNACAEKFSPSTGLGGEKYESAHKTTQVTLAKKADFPDKVRNRRKADLPKRQHLKDINKRDMLSNCLSDERVRRWCVFEWFYSAIDYPWFAKKEFVEYLKHVGLGHVPRLTRVEWGVIRSSLGKPRRFSEQFLKEEKEKLNQYRDSVRKHYTELREGVKEGLPADLARPLFVGQRIMAIHPKTRDIYNGNVLTVDHKRCRVQFDKPEMGVEFVLDIDCMPLNPLENMPTFLARNAATMDKLFTSYNELKMNIRGNDQKLEGVTNLSPASHLSDLMKQAKDITNEPNMQAQDGINEADNSQKVANSALLAQIQAKEADVQALAELTRALEKKGAVVAELKHMNDDADAVENQKDGDNALRNSESFKKQYAAVIVQLNSVNGQVSRALRDLRQRNTYQSSLPAWPKTTSIVGDSDGPLNSFNQQKNNLLESESYCHEIVESSRKKAQTLVDSAMQAISSMKMTIEDNPLQSIEDTIDHISDSLSWDNSFVGVTRPLTTASSMNGSLALSKGPKFEPKNALDKKEVQIPSELISHCVATLLMIQKCTERQYPPAEVAQILESAVVSLQPCSPQNIGVYGEIQKCMGIIRNQILALIP